MTVASTNPKKLTLKKDLTCTIDCVKVKPFFVFNLVTVWAFFGTFWTFSELFLELGSGSKTFLGPTYVNNQFWFWMYSPIYLFLIRPHFGPHLHFLVIWGYFWGRDQVQKPFWDLPM